MQNSNDSSGSNTDTPTFGFAGWGKVEWLKDLDTRKTEAVPLDQGPKHILGRWSATAICGNDITSSCLYVSALAAVYAGIFAPLALLMVSLTLFLFRKIYGEVGSSLPLNGGTYTVLLNTTSKKLAAAAACLTILSYISTAVISANEAVHYLATMNHDIHILSATVALLAAFAFLSFLGVGESASVALFIFMAHILTLILVVLFGIYHGLQDLTPLFSNLTESLHREPWYLMLMKGFFVALLGISGFESSANFIEEQKAGVFNFTLKYMWLAVTIFNPILCLLVLVTFPSDFISQNQNNILAKLGAVSLGKPFAMWIAIDAFLVLSGAVLTSYVGITGLARRMALDRCLPRWLLKENKWRKTNHWIIFLFFLLCVSVLMITRGDIISLASVYTISFLAVMFLFGVGNALLKVRRSRLPRDERAPWSYVIWGLMLVGFGLIGNIWLNPEGFNVFAAYYFVTISVIFFLLLRSQILRFFYLAIQYSIDLLPITKSHLGKWIEKHIGLINSQPMIYFSKGDGLNNINRAALYVLNNEQTTSLQIVHVYKNESDIPSALGDQARVIDQIYPELKVDLILVKGEFGPELIELLSRDRKVAKNHMFIGTPGDRFPHRLESLGGVRVII